MCSAFVRKNGWSLPLHHRQIALWICLACMVALYYGVYVQYLPFTWRLVGIFIVAVIFVSHVISHVITVSIDPGANHVRNRSDGVTGGYCQTCQVNFLETTKHCRVCNKCIEQFDHHCAWLNNCIGSRNYWPFLVTLVTGFIMVVLFAVFGFVLFVLFFATRNNLCYSECLSSTNSSDENTLKLFGGEVPDVVFIIITGIVTLLSWIACGLLGHLLAFHVYFIVKGITTYNHMMKSARENQKYPFLCCICPKQRSRVAPLKDGSQANGNWVTSSDEHLGSHETVATSHNTPDDNT